jgi:GNAT superfamily N-acetyltransferase
MMELKRTNSVDPGFAGLVKFLDAELAERDGADHAFYAQFNKLDKINHAVVAYKDGVPVGCGAIKEFTPGTMEVKRMYTKPECRREGIASKILEELEMWAVELSCGRCVLETGKRQPEAIGLYKKNGYRIIPNFGQYAGVENSVCFEKELRAGGIV